MGSDAGLTAFQGHLEEQLTPVLVNGETPLANGLEKLQSTDMALLHAFTESQPRLERKAYVMSELWIQSDGDYDNKRDLLFQKKVDVKGAMGIPVSKSGNVILLTNKDVIMISLDTGSVIRRFSFVLERYACYVYNAGVAVDQAGLIWVFTTSYKIHARMNAHVVVAFTEEGKAMYTINLDGDLEPLKIAAIDFNPQGRLVILTKESAHYGSHQLRFYDHGELEHVNNINLSLENTTFHICQRTGEIHVLCRDGITSKIVDSVSNGDYKCTNTVPKACIDMTLLGDGRHMFDV